MPMIISARELMFDPSVAGYFRPLNKRDQQQMRQEKPKPLDVFNGNPKEKLWRMAGLRGADSCLELAIHAVLYHFYNDSDEFNPFGPKYGLYEQRYVDTHEDDHRIREGINDWLWDNQEWEQLLTSEPLHVCFDEFIRPLRDRIQELFETSSEGDEYHG